MRNVFANLFRSYANRLTMSGLAMLGGLVTAAHAQDTDAAARSSYSEKVQPILARNCSGCHTLGGHAGGLKLDSLDTLLEGGSRGPAIVPGKPESSILSKAVHYDNDPKMPPRGKIAPAEITAIDAWIKDHPALKTALKTLSLAPAPKDAALTASSPAHVSPAAEQLKETVPPVSALTAITPAQEKLFEDKIRPFFAKNCYGCHTSPPSADLRVDSREAILKGGKDGVVVVPGHPEQSLLVKALKYSSKIQMPPRGPVSNEEVALIEQWIREGAPWPAKSAVAPASRVTPAQREFWAFHSASEPAVPAIASPWVANDIDRFIFAKLQEKNLKPVRDADKRTLARRVTYGLTGLPPSPGEVEEFLNDKSAQAYEKLVDRLLASKSYGERWGRKWLDVVRYADTDGGSGDFPIPQAS